MQSEDFDVKIMGVLNRTPDSFSDGGRYMPLYKAVEHSLRLEKQGADYLDIGGASSHHKAAKISQEEEISRVLDLVTALEGKISIPLSIDTSHHKLIEHCADKIDVINDISGATNHKMADLAAEYNLALTITYNNNNIDQSDFSLDNMESFFESQLQWASNRGVKRLMLDPGYGFGKSVPENILVIKNIPRIKAFGYPVMSCLSRKRSLSKISGNDSPASDRLAETLAATIYSVEQGANILRVHDVDKINYALRVWGVFKGYSG